MFVLLRIARCSVLGDGPKCSRRLLYPNAFQIAINLVASDLRPLPDVMNLKGSQTLFTYDLVT